MSVYSKVNILMTNIIYHNTKIRRVKHVAKGQWTSYNIKQINSLPLSSHPFTKQSQLKQSHSFRNSAESVCMV